MSGEAAREASKPKTIVALGEALWDLFPDGRRPGGAPCNVAFHAGQLGDRAAIVTRVGDDSAGSDLIGLLQDRGVDTSLVQRDDRRPTGSVVVAFNGPEPRYTIASEVAWDAIAAEAHAQARIRTSDAICFGSLAQRSERSRAALQALVAAAGSRALVVFDVNLRFPFVDASVIDSSMRFADVVKMNDSELEQLSALLGRSDLVSWLLRDRAVRLVCVTRAEGGASLTTPHETLSVHGIAVDSSTGDPVGAGDAFTAAMVHQLVRDVTPERTLHAANQYAALVATKQGAMPVLSQAELASVDW